MWEERFGKVCEEARCGKRDLKRGVKRRRVKAELCEYAFVGGVKRSVKRGGRGWLGIEWEGGKEGIGGGCRRRGE